METKFTRNKRKLNDPAIPTTIDETTIIETNKIKLTKYIFIIFVIGVSYLVSSLAVL